MCCGRHIVKTAVAVPLMIFLFAATAVRAQLPEDEHIYIHDFIADEYNPHIEADSSVFYRAVQSTEDIFADVSDYGLSFVPYHRRGVRTYGETAMFNGLPVRSEYASTLSRLNIERWRYSGLRHSEHYVGRVNGYTEYRSAYSVPLSSHRVSAGFSTKGYNAGVSASVSEQFDKGWSLSAYLSGRTGRDLYVKGVFSNSASAGISVVKQWNLDRMLNIIFMYSPSERGVRRASTDEAFTLVGNNLYNPSWGLQCGKVRNANVRRSSLPSMLVSYDMNLSGRTYLTFTLGTEAGVTRYSSLDWFDALTPMPDNYRFMPSYYDDAQVAADVASAWRKDDRRYTQIDWDDLYERNRLAGNHSVYAVSDRVNRITKLSMRGEAVTLIGRDLTLGYGMSMSYSRSRSFRQMRDLLGGRYIIDKDYYLADDATYRTRLQNDLRNPDRIVREGGRYGYDYAAVNRYAGVYVVLNCHRDRSRFDLAAELGAETAYRRGYFEKELFAGNESFGRSRKIGMSPYSIKLSYGYSFTPRHYIELSGAACGYMPDFEDLFLQTQYNNRIIDNPRLRKEYASELNYTFLHRSFNLRATLFAMALLDNCEVSHYYDDLAGEYCDMVVTDINRLNAGVEIAATIRLARHWNASVSVVAGRYTYISDPRVSLYADTDNRVLCNRAVAHMGACTAGSAPQIAATADATYRNRGWGVRLRANYAGFRYVEAAPVRRTDRVAKAPSVSEEIFKRFVGQERLPDAVTLDAAVWKSFRLTPASSSYMVVSFAADNITGNRNIVYSARESLRIRRTYIADGYIYSPFPTTRLYAYPLTLRLSVSYRF